MTYFKVTIKQDAGMGRVTNEKLFYRGIQSFNSSFGKDMANVAREGIANPPKSGRIYSHNGRKHRASAPMQYPANRSGLLRRRTTFKSSGLQVEVGTIGVAYAPMLQQFKTAQQRTSSWSRLAPRPYITLAHDTVVKNNIPAKMISSVEAEIG